MKTSGRAETLPNKFLISALDAGEWSTSCSARYAPGKPNPDAHWTGGWVGLTADLDIVIKRKICSPARNQIPIIYPTLTETSQLLIHYILSVTFMRILDLQLLMHLNAEGLHCLSCRQSLEDNDYICDIMSSHHRTLLEWAYLSNFLQLLQTLRKKIRFVTALILDEADAAWNTCH